MGESTPPGPSPPSVRRTALAPLPDWVHPATLAVHGGRRPDFNAGAVVPPIYQTSTFRYPADFSEAADAEPYLYTRMRNPTLEVASELVARLEGAEAASVFGSGMGALASALLARVRPGEEVVALESLYGGTLELLDGLMARFGVKIRWVPDDASEAPTTFLRPSTRVVLLESPTNPTLRVHDLVAWSRAAERVGATVIVDNTFATPINQNPLAWGAHLVVHSATKYLGGHSDLVAGVVVGTSDLIGEIDATRTSLGSVLDPFAAFLLVRGIRTLALRVERHNANGRHIVDAITGHPKVLRVDYPGRGGPNEEEIATRQMRGRGGMVALEIAGGAAAATRFLRRLRLITVAASLGGVESLASVPKQTSHRHLTPEELRRRGIGEGLVRLSLGIEDPRDLERDIREALEGV
ncbi:MAG: trans-sulfuration enzyme family protein [Thermoplasmata archaeon]